jgi:hypothetical protein
MSRLTLPNPPAKPVETLKPLRPIEFQMLATEELQDKIGSILDQVSAPRTGTNEVTGDAPTATMVDTDSNGVATTTVLTTLVGDARGFVSGSWPAGG